MNRDQRYFYPSRRTVTYGRRGMVATSQPLAAQVGLDILKKGGNAVDAAIATAATLTVVEPTGNGIGGDAFAIVWMKDEMFGLNASGVTPQAISHEVLKEAGHSSMPRRGWAPVMVPGQPAGWAALSERFGNLPFEELMEPAASYAAEGFQVTPTIAQLWQNAYREFEPIFKDSEFQPWFDHFAPEGRAPVAGEIWQSQDMADTLRLIGQTQARTFYEGELADRIDHFARETGGYLRKADLVNYQPEWVTPISASYRGYDIWELPPNNSGVIVLMALQILDGMDLDGLTLEEWHHYLIEAMKLAYSDGKHYIADPKAMSVTVDELLDPEYAKTRRALISESARMPEAGQLTHSGTVYLATADREGNMVSYIQSNYQGFGSGIVVPGTGIGLQNRGYAFNLDPDSPRSLEPGKKAYHTIIPAFLTKDQQPIGPFGVMGAFMQPQGHLQVLTHMIDRGLNPQDALNVPRWQWTEGLYIQVEPNFDRNIVTYLIQRGHQIKIMNDSLSFGRGQMIFRQESGGYVGASEPRTDGIVASW